MLKMAVVVRNETLITNINAMKMPKLDGFRGIFKRDAKTIPCCSHENAHDFGLFLKRPI